MKVACLTFCTFYAFCAFHAFCAYKKNLSESCLLAFCIFCAFSAHKKHLSESILFTFCTFVLFVRIKNIWVKIACLRFVLFVHIKNVWAKVAYLRFVLFMLFVCLKSFHKKKKDYLNTLNYITTKLIPLLKYFSMIAIFFNYHNFFQFFYNL